MNHTPGDRQFAIRGRFFRHLDSRRVVVAEHPDLLSSGEEDARHRVLRDDDQTLHEITCTPKPGRRRE